MAEVAPPLSDTPENGAKPAENPMPAASKPVVSENPEKAGKTAKPPAQGAHTPVASEYPGDAGKPADRSAQAAIVSAVSENPEKAGKPAEHAAPSAAAPPASGIPEKAEKPETGLRRRVDLPGIGCSPVDRPDVRVTISLRLSCGGVRAEREILFKREDLKVMAHSVVSKLLMADITAEKLRPALMTAMNRILSDGTIDTIEVARVEINAKR